MCASYGLGGDRIVDDWQAWSDLPPLDERVQLERVRAWADERRGSARITGVNARNLNPVIVQQGDGRDVELAWWWIHLGNQPARFSAFNARAETLTAKWKPAIKRRGLAPATWYVEKGKRCSLAGAIFAIATITTTARQDDGTEMLTYALVTRASTGAAASVHPRMPLILPADAQDEWLDPYTTATPEMVAAMVGASEEVSQAVTLG